MKPTSYERLECLGLWRSAPNLQRIEVIVTFGKSTLVFLDSNDNPLGHWSLGATRRLNPHKMPAMFSPEAVGVDATAGETLQIDDVAIIAHIEYLQSRAGRGRARPGRVRFWLGFAVLVIFIAGLVVFFDDLVGIITANR